MHSGKTLYLRVYDSIITDIFNETYALGDKLPTLYDLCEFYQVSRNTIRSAMTLLQDNGYIILEKGTRARICMDLHDVSTNQMFLQTLINRRKMNDDVFSTMEIIMPDIVVQCLNSASKEDIERLNQKVKTFDRDPNVKTLQQIMRYLMEIYLTCITLLHNPLLTELFTVMMTSIVLPISDVASSTNRLQSHISQIKKILVTVMNFALHGNNFMIRTIIKKFTATYHVQVLKYIDRICEDRKPNELQAVSCFYRFKHHYLYDHVVLNVMLDVLHGVYVNDAFLPSMSELAKHYQVSMRTSRKAIEVLNEIGIVKTINGIGTKIAIDKQMIGNFEHISEHLKETAIDCYHAKKLLSLIASILLEQTLRESDEMSIQQLIIKLQENDSYLHHTLYQFLFHRNNDFMRSIFYDLTQPAIWDVYVQIAFDTSVYKQQQDMHRDELCTLLKQRKFKKINGILQKINDPIDVITYQFIELLHA